MSKTARKPQVKRASANDRYVVPRDGGWDIIKEGHRRATGRAKTKAEAVDSARRMVRKDGGGELRIVNRSGKLVDSDTIRPAKRRAA
jgi:hypothetical protein